MAISNCEKLALIEVALQETGRHYEISVAGMDRKISNWDRDGLTLEEISHKVLDSLKDWKSVDGEGQQFESMSENERNSAIKNAMKGWFGPEVYQEYLEHKTEVGSRDRERA